METAESVYRKTKAAIRNKQAKELEKLKKRKDLDYDYIFQRISEEADIGLFQVQFTYHELFTRMFSNASKIMNSLKDVGFEVTYKNTVYTVSWREQ